MSLPRSDIRGGQKRLPHLLQLPGSVIDEAPPSENSSATRALHRPADDFPIRRESYDQASPRAELIDFFPGNPIRSEGISDNNSIAIGQDRRPYAENETKNDQAGKRNNSDDRIL
jgi:hypothetical protein